MNRATRAIEQRYNRLERCDTPLDFTLFRRRDATWLPLATNEAETLVVMGEIFERGPSRSAPSRPADVRHMRGSLDDMARKLVADHWGTYVAFLRDRVSGRLKILRDPSGGLPLSLVGDERAGFATDFVPRWLHEALIGRPEIDWDVVTAQLLDPSVVSHRSLLKGVRLIPAGALSGCGTYDEPSQIWVPHIIAARATRELPRAVERLRFTVFDAATALTASSEPLMLELSGGLDSSVLLAGLAGRQGARTPTCINLATSDTGGDERAFARAAADRHGATLVEIMLDQWEMDYTPLADQADCSVPRGYGADSSHERVSSEVAAATGSAAIVTGQGGDAVFFQEPTPLVAADHLRIGGFDRRTWRTVLDSADRANTNVWSVIAASRRARRPTMKPLVEHDGSLLGPALGHGVTVPLHPWLSRFDDLLPPNGSSCACWPPVSSSGARRSAATAGI